MASAYSASSPPRAVRHDLSLPASSSPDLPSLREILSKPSRKGPLRSGSNAVPVPPHALTTFTTAASLWKSAQDETLAKQKANENADPDTSVSIVEIPPESFLPAKKPRRRKAVEDNAEQLKHKANEPMMEAGSPSKDKPWKRFRMPADGTHHKTNGLRDIATSKDAMREKPKVTGKVSHHFSTQAAEKKNRQSRSISPEKDNNAPLQLEQAIPRRVEWTPPRPSAVITIDTNTSDAIEQHSSPQLRQNTSKDVFESLLDNFGCRYVANGAIQAPETETASAVTVLTKRKAIEMVTISDANAASARREKSPAKQKAPRKKPRTITELATAAYAPVQPVSEQPQSSVLSLLARENKEPPGLGATDPNKAKKPRKSNKASKKKTEDNVHLILLSPNAAMKQVDAQDFVFGTSSQLVREQSPTLLRDLHRAIRLSESVDKLSDPFAMPTNSDAVEPEECTKLWDAGARDENGRLLDMEVIDLVDSPDMSVMGVGADPFGYFKGDELASTKQTDTGDAKPDEDSFLDLTTLLQTQRIIASEGIIDDSPFFPASQVKARKSASNMTAKESIRQSSSLRLHDAESGPSDSARSSTKPRIGDQAVPLSTTGMGPLPPRYDLFTDAQLAREITSYGFKPVKRRDGMIALLSQCWESKNRIALGSLTPNAAMSTAAVAALVPEEPVEKAQLAAKRSRGRPRKQTVTSAAAGEPLLSAHQSISPKRPRGRPRKDAVASKPVPAPNPKTNVKATSSTAPLKAKTATSTPQRRKALSQDVVEIPDSDAEDFLSPTPSPEPTYSFSSPPAVDVSLSMTEDTELSLTMSPTSEQSASFAFITKAITAAPRSSDPDKPSWHEKMLLYDPVVLEDLAAWLNSGHLTQVGFNDEVSALDVKKWCESRSVLCLWRESLRGRERKRF
jgi:hypothetical protein